MTENAPATVGGTTRPILLASDDVTDHDVEPWEIRVTLEPRLELTPDLRDVVRIDPAMIGLVVKLVGVALLEGPELGRTARDRVEALLPIDVARALWSALGRGLEAADGLAVGEAQAASS